MPELDGQSPASPAGNDAPRAPASSEPPRVLALAEMLFASKVRGAAAAARVRVASSPDPRRLLAADPDAVARLILVDLDVRSAVDFIRQVRADPRREGVPLIGFASHTNTAVIEAGRSAGADRVLARSAFVQLLPTLINDVAV